MHCRAAFSRRRDTRIAEMAILEGKVAAMGILDQFPLSSKQIDFVVNSQARINVADGAIRSGKTFSSLLRWMMYVAEAPAGELIVVGRTAHTIFRNVFKPLMDESLFGAMAKTNSYTAGAPTGRILGREVHVVGFNDARAEAKIRGFTCAGAYADELTLASKDFFTQLMGRMSVPGAKMFATTNADHPSHWLKKEYLDREGELNLRRFVFQLSDNPSLTNEYKRDITAEFSGLFYQRFVLGMWVQAEGAVYDCWNPEVHVVSDEDIPPIYKWLGIGIDYGTTNPFAAVLVGLGVDHRLYAVDELRYDSKQMQKQKTDAEYSRSLFEWLTTGVRLNGKKLGFNTIPARFCIDPSATSFKAQIRKDHMIPQNADNDVENGIRCVASLLAADKLRVSANCKGLLEEFPAYAWDPKKSDQGLDQVIKQQDHSLDALRYTLYTTRYTWRPEVGISSLA